MPTSPLPLRPAAAARQLGVSAKALRVYEQHGLVVPLRSATGWRSYGPREMARAAQVVALRALGFRLEQVGRVLAQGTAELAQALAAQQTVLEARLQGLAHTLEQVQAARGALAQGRLPDVAAWADLPPPAPVRLAFDLPWPWGGERFELPAPRPLTYITGPLGSGKTRLALRIAQALPATWLGLERLADRVGAALEPGSGAAARAEQALAELVAQGATPSPALLVLLAGLARAAPAACVVDMVEQGLDQRSQELLLAWLRRRGPKAQPLFLLTRSCAVLDLAAVGPDEAILFCPANHSPPLLVDPRPGAPGREALASCLASPQVRARTEGMVARMRRGAAHRAVPHQPGRLARSAQMPAPDSSMPPPN